MGYQDSNLGMMESKSIALPTWLYPNELESGLFLDNLVKSGKYNMNAAQQNAAPC